MIISKKYYEGSDLSNVCNVTAGHGWKWEAADAQLALLLLSLTQKLSLFPCKNDNSVQKKQQQQKLQNDQRQKPDWPFFFLLACKRISQSMSPSKTNFSSLNHKKSKKKSKAQKWDTAETELAVLLRSDTKHQHKNFHHIASRKIDIRSFHLEIKRNNMTCLKPNQQSI